MPNNVAARGAALYGAEAVIATRLAPASGSSAANAVAVVRSVASGSRRKRAKRLAIPIADSWRL